MPDDTVTLEAKLKVTTEGDLDAMKTKFANIKQSIELEREAAKQTIAIKKQNTAIEIALMKQEEAAAKQTEKVKADAAKMALNATIAEVKAAGAAIKQSEKEIMQNKLANTKQQAMLMQYMAAEDAKAQKKVQDNTKKTGSVFQSLGGIIKNAFSFLIGGSIFAAIYRLINGFQELIKTGEDYAQTIYRLGVSINQLQRRGLDITIKSEIELIKELQAQYSTFSKKGVIEAVTSVQMLTRNFGFNQEQIKRTIQLSMDLALVQGKDVGETAKQLALFYSSGYGEGLQHAGLAVNRMTVAQEANRMGMRKSYMQLTELQRAEAAESLVFRQTTDLHGDAVKIQESLIGKIKEQRSAIENVTNEIALRALPIELAWLKIKLALAQAIGDLVTENQLWMESIEEVAKSKGVELLGDFEFDMWGNSGKMAADVFANKYYDEVNKIFKEKKDKNKEMWENIVDEFGNVTIGGINLDEEAAAQNQKLGDEIRKWLDDLEQANKDHAKEEEELEKEHNKTMEEIDAESAAKRLEIWEDYQEDLANIDEDLAQTIADHQLDASRKATDLDREYQLSIQEANKKFHEQEIKAERDYQDRLKRLREEFLFDLEDALRARDAIQVLRLIRRYNLDKQQEKDKYDEEKEQRDEANREELDDLAKQHAETERQNQLDLQRQIEDANTAAERKRQDALENYEKARDDEAAALQEQVNQENAKYQERQAALDADLQATTNKINEKFGEWLATEGISLDKMHKLLATYMDGKEGLLTSVINGYVSAVDAAANQYSDDMAKMQAALDAYVADVLKQAEALKSAGVPIPNIFQPNSTPVPGVQPGTLFPPYAGGQAEGGSYFARKPTMAMFGEAGPELATFTPLNQLRASSGNPSVSLGGLAGGGIAKIELWLSPDLEARIVDNTLGQAAEIFTDVARIR